MDHLLCSTSFLCFPSIRWIQRSTHQCVCIFDFGIGSFPHPQFSGWYEQTGITLCCCSCSSSTTRFMCSSSSPSSAACWGARAVEEALPRTAGPPGPRLRLLLLPPDSRSWFISKSQLATSWTFARLSEEEKGLTCCKWAKERGDKNNTLN